MKIELWQNSVFHIELANALFKEPRFDKGTVSSSLEENLAFDGDLNTSCISTVCRFYDSNIFKEIFIKTNEFSISTQQLIPSLKQQKINFGLHIPKKLHIKFTWDKYGTKSVHFWCLDSTKSLPNYKWIASGDALPMPLFIKELRSHAKMLEKNYREFNTKDFIENLDKITKYEL